MVTKSLVEVPFSVHGLIFIESVRGPLQHLQHTEIRNITTQFNKPLKVFNYYANESPNCSKIMHALLHRTLSSDTEEV